MLTNTPKHQVSLTLSQLDELGALKEHLNSSLLDIMNITGKNHAELDLSIIWPDTAELPELYNQLTDLQACLDSLRPLSPAQLKNLQESFDIEYTYESNRIEGNTLTLMETSLVISKGFTIQGKQLNEHLEAINHQQAIDYIREMVTGDVELNKRVLLDIHALILQVIDRENAGQYRKENVQIQGSRHVCPDALFVSELMDKLFEFYDENKTSMHPVELAAEMHERLVTIHPFIDGNGRTARLMMNLILMKHGYPITVINSDNDKRNDYYNTLEKAQISEGEDKTEFKVLIAQYVKTWLFKYLNIVSPSMNGHSEGKGYTYFKKIAPLIKNK
jgi:Fic family protein